MGLLLILLLNVAPEVLLSRSPSLSPRSLSLPILACQQHPAQLVSSSDTFFTWLQDTPSSCFPPSSERWLLLSPHCNHCWAPGIVPEPLSPPVLHTLVGTSSSLIALNPSKCWICLSLISGRDLSSMANHLLTAPLGCLTGILHWACQNRALAVPWDVISTTTPQAPTQLTKLIPRPKSVSPHDTSLYSHPLSKSLSA